MLSSSNHAAFCMSAFCAFFSLGSGTAVSAQSAPAIESRFDTGTTQGWTATAWVAFHASATGGNPGGYLHIDNSEGPVCFLVAPAAYLGDLRAYLGGTLSFDGKMIGTGGSPWFDALDYGHVFLSNGGSQIVVDLAPAQPSTSQYTTYSVRLLPADWNVSAATFDAILSNVTDLSISVEALYGSEVQAIDNVIITAPAYLATASTFASGCPSSGGSNTLVATSLPWVGTAFQSSATGLPNPAFVLAVFGLAPVVPPLPLANVFPQGVPGCNLHVSPDFVGAVFSTTSTAQAQLVLPNLAGLAGIMFYHQMVPIQVDGALNFLAITSTNALVMTVGVY